MAAALATLVALPVIPAGVAAPTAQTLRRAPLTQPAAVPGEIVVGFRSGVDAPERVAARSAADVRAKRALLSPNAQLVKVEPGQTVTGAVKALERRSDVRYAEPNWIYHT